ncbi:MAG: transglycosylase domain-containing protein [Polaromonas sp.]|nr:transglycosylase domain-containing protein [Polaromonas sp.]
MKAVLRLIALVLLAGLSLQLYFVARIALMAAIDPESTAFERSEVYRVVTTTGSLKWRQQWVPYSQISDHLKSAVIASEDASFVEHDGVDLEALEKAWDKNAKAEQKAQQSANRPGPGKSPFAAAASTAKPAERPVVKPPKIVGGSTITQQLAKNLFLSGERTLLRKGQELVLTLLLEALLSKERILEIYLNSVEWGEGVFGAEAAAQHYYRKSASKLSAFEAARLAVMLPRPKYFETRPNSGYLSSRAGTIAARMGGVEIP